jgi:hypothetical protein
MNARQLETCARRLQEFLTTMLASVGRLGEQLVFRQATVALCHRFHKRVFKPGPGANHRRLGDPQPFGNQVGRLEADTDDIAGEALRICAHHRDRIGPVGLVDVHRPRRSYAVALQECHDVANDSRIGPACGDACRTFRTDTCHLG